MKKKEWIFTSVGQDIYFLEHQTLGDDLREKLIALHQSEETHYYYLEPVESHLVWTNFLNFNISEGINQVEFVQAISQLWYYFNIRTPMRLEQLPKHEIIFYPGTFSPWHEGHAACVKKAMEKTTVLIVPDKNPQKDFYLEKSPLRRYLNLCHQIKNSTSLGPLFIYPGFLITEDVNPTNSWFKTLRANFPSMGMHLLVGFDSFKNLPSWIEADQLLLNVSTVMVVSRNESQAELDLCTNKLKLINPELRILHLGHHKFERISSTHIRKQMGRSY
jgi:nicotinic acid mononucleotide adenylyltransferase